MSHSFTLSVIDGLAQHQGTLRLSLGDLHGYIYPETSIHWRIQEATVACRQLGFPVFKAFAYNHFGPKTGWRLMSYVSCLGSERVIEQCERNYGQGKVISNDFHGVICTGMDDYEVRLSDGQYDRGRVELSIGGTWGSVLSSSVWSSGKNAKVICTQLGFESGVAITNGTYLHGAGPVWIRDLNCAGHERSIRDCSFTINGTDFYSRSSTPDVGVVCLNQKFTHKFPNQTLTQVTSSTKTSKSSQNSQDNMSTTELVFKTKNSSEGNEETPDEKDNEHEIIHDNTGMFIGISLAALSFAILVILAICWKMRSTIRKDASLSVSSLKESDTHQEEQSSNGMEQNGYQTMPFQRQDNPSHINFNQNNMDYNSEHSSNNNPFSGLHDHEGTYLKLLSLSPDSTVRPNSSYASVVPSAEVTSSSSNG
ncbi:deleted in malignant brain tumors 1 protein-like [Saccostrea echinata]|uniref:deleted in malignant brain tumors 1 protein-like n=1 Tax=Saccostrea echinata TaxID=191078 RepID=UPI002A7F6730|nr:deleted in malignant brain tumors 1 protein-like [Saccostrea echinata]